MFTVLGMMMLVYKYNFELMFVSFYDNVLSLHVHFRAALSALVNRAAEGEEFSTHMVICKYNAQCIL